MFALRFLAAQSLTFGREYRTAQRDGNGYERMRLIA